MSAFLQGRVFLIRVEIAGTGSASMSSITFTIERVESAVTQKVANRAKARLTPRRPVQGMPLRMKTSQTIDIDIASVTTWARRFDTEYFMKAPSATKESLVAKRTP
jgi:hypothetical protein